jgi:outer membrane immunogenic protein
VSERDLYRRHCLAPRVSNAGWTVGGGVEFAFADNWTAKAEYLFVDFGRVGCPSQTVCATAGVSLTENIIRNGINYKFYW